MRQDKLTPFMFAPYAGNGSHPTTVALVGGSLDGSMFRIANVDHFIDPGAVVPVLNLAILSGAKFSLLRRRAEGGLYRVTSTRVLTDLNHTVEAYVFSGHRRVSRRFLPAAKIPVFAHVDTRPLRVSSHPEGSYLEAD